MSEWRKRTKREQREALAVLDRLRQKHFSELSARQWLEQEAFLQEVLGALIVLTDVAYPRTKDTDLFLCRTCHLARTMEPEPRDAQGYLMWVCAACYRKQQQGGRADQMEEL